MVFSSVEFLFLFLPVFLAVIFLTKDKYQNALLLLLSLLFYAWGEPKFVFVLLLSIIWNYMIALLVEKTREHTLKCKTLLFIGIVVDLGMLLLYKYLDVLVHDFNVLTSSNYNSLNLALPIGISFFVFQEISYILDVYFQVVPAERNIISVALYISFFPKLLMGPIMRYRDFRPQLANRNIDLEHLSVGIKRFITGMVKKVILSAPFGIIVDDAFSRTGSDLPVALAWIALPCYCLQLYFDFSGYSDMAIGLGKMCGFEIPENFDYPYLATSISEYWRRWHITLGVWFKDYLYTPLFRFLMRRKHPVTREKYSLQTCDLLALGVTWICTGIWHGAGSSFLFYGLWYYIFIAWERIRDARRKKLVKQGKRKKAPPTAVERVSGHITTLIIVLCGQLLFRSNGVLQAFAYVKAMLGLQGNPLVDRTTILYLQDNLVYFVVGIIFTTPIVSRVRAAMQRAHGRQLIYQATLPVIYAVAFVIAIAFAVSGQQTSFIYFQF